MIIDIDGIKKTNPGADAAKGAAEIPEEKIPNMYPDGRRRYGDELAEIVSKFGAEKFLLALIGADKDDSTEEACTIIKEGLVFYDGLIVPRITRTPEELGFLAFVVETISGILSQGLKEEPAAQSFKRILESIFRVKFRSETIVCHVKKEDNNGN